MMQKIARTAFSSPVKSPIVSTMRILRLSTVATVKTAAKSRGIMRFFDRFSSKVAEQAEKNDMAQLEKFIELTKYFREFRIPLEHPINDAAEKTKALRSIDGAGSNVKDILVALDNYKAFVIAQNEPYKKELLLASSINPPEGEEIVVDEAAEAAIQVKWQTTIRLRLLDHYLNNLKAAIQEGDINPNAIAVDSINRIIDSFLLGTSSERLQEHMKLYSPKFTNPQLQDCFYTLYNSEVDCASAIFLEVKDMHKHHIKGMAKFAKNFLLDSLELNEKTRCVFAWSDPNFKGFQPLPDEHVIALEALLPSRRKYFKEGTTVATTLMTKYVGDRRMYYVEKKDTQETNV